MEEAAAAVASKQLTGDSAGSPPRSPEVVAVDGRCVAASSIPAATSCASAAAVSAAFGSAAVVCLCSFRSWLWLWLWLSCCEDAPKMHLKCTLTVIALQVESSRSNQQSTWSRH